MSCFFSTCNKILELYIYFHLDYLSSCIPLYLLAAGAVVMIAVLEIIESAVALSIVLGIAIPVFR